MRVFMLGWEFPPFISGGLGTACYGLTKAMSAQGTEIVFVLPRPVSTPFSTHVRVLGPAPSAPPPPPPPAPVASVAAEPEAAPQFTEFYLDEFEHVTFRSVNAALDPYTTPAEYVVQQTIAKRRLVTAAPAPAPSAAEKAAAEPARGPPHAGLHRVGGA